MNGPEVGSLYLIENGARVRVVGRTWEFAGSDDAVEVRVERADGSVLEEQLTLAEFEELTARAKHRL